jgi:ABC-type Co2+ transport system permease subunit
MIQLILYINETIIVFMHIHVPDGVFPVWLWVSSIAILLPLVIIAVFMVRNNQKKLVVTSAITALMLIVFSVEFFGYHLNFTSLSGIILGPWWSLISITIVNVFLALFGHGGITVAPVNIIINWVEALIGYSAFYLIKKIKNIDLKSFLSGAVVILSLAISFSLFLGIVALTNINPGLALEQTGMANYVPLKEFAIISLIPTMIGAVIEAMLTIFVVRFILKTKPGLLK